MQTRAAPLSLIAELKRRNVFKVGAAYLALAWVMVQATGAVVPALNLPATLVPTVVWIAIIGFPCVLIFSWVYELTPEGLKRESEVDRSQSITNVTSKRLDYIIIAMLAVAMLMFAADRFLPHGSDPVTAVGAGLARDSGIEPGADRAQGALPQQAPTPAPDDNSIAVLPFADMSAAKDQEYMSDGIAEELLNLLAKLPELRVIARTSSFSFKGQNLEIPEIARRLGVANVLEGSVRTAGNRVRVTAQLVRASDGAHLWSETYDRTLDDIFSVQDDIAGKVVGQLQIKLLGRKAPVSATMRPEAYSLYMEGLYFSRSSNRENLAKAEEKYKEAVALDAAAVDGWAGLAEVYWAQAGQGFRSMVEGVPLAQEAVARALALDPDSARALTVQGRISSDFMWDFVKAEKELARALELEPGNAGAIRALAALASTLGRLDKAAELHRRAIALDPLRPGSYHSLGILLFLQGDPKLAEDNLRKAVELAPDQATTRSAISQVQLLSGRPQEALQSIEREHDAGWKASGLPMVYFALDRKAEADAALKSFIESFGKDWAYQIAENYAFMGQNDAAFEWLERAYRQPDAGLAQMLADPLLRNLHDDPRWLPFLQKMRLDQHWAEYKAKYLGG
jgi:TolB-like protein/Tfp pilus assembly protein PilF